MPRSLVVGSVVVAALACRAVAAADPPRGFSAPRVVGAGLEVSGVVAAADAPRFEDAAVAFADRSGGVWAARVPADGSVRTLRPVARSQLDARDVQVVVTERGEVVAEWAALTGRSGQSAVRYAVGGPGRAFSEPRTLATVGSNTSASARIAALRGGTVAVIFRDTRPPRSGGVLRYARRPPRGSFGRARSLGHDGVSPQIQASPGGGALLAWARGPLTRRALEVSSAQRGAPLPGRASSVAGRVRDITLVASADGTAWVAWTRRAGGPATGYARRTRSINRAAVGPVQTLGTVAYGAPHIALGSPGRVLVAWNARGPGDAGTVGLASAQGTGTALGAPGIFDAGGFSQTSPIPALKNSTPLVVFTRQIASAAGERAEVAAANAATGEITVLGPAASIGAPAIAHGNDALVAAWAAQGGGAAVSVDR